MTSADSTNDLRAPSAPAATLEADSAGIARAAHDADGGDLRSIVSERPGSVVGRYKLLQELGQGGFGTVFLAEQREPVVRQVALKVIKLGMDTRQVIARFEAERQALAIMDHPHIARVLDAGATERGRPYFVMELVRGATVTSFCDLHKLTIRQRLSLFADVCRAVQHAHTKGIIHRDIKPSNILVAMHDDRPVPKVIDFGIAKATHGNLTDNTVLTEARQFIGTPAYMSPEQASASSAAGADVDTRTDIYSLGVLLYEMLTGVTPFDRRLMRNSSLDEMRRLIQEVVPTRPSTRIGILSPDAEPAGAGAPPISGATSEKPAAGSSAQTALSAADIAIHRRTSPTGLRRQLRGELDVIALKCLAKERDRRYQTAADLARDVQNYLDGRPIEARRDSAWYVFRKTLRRYRIPAAIAAGFVLVIAAALGVTTRLWHEAVGNAATADANALSARRESANASLVSGFLASLLEHANPSLRPEADVSVRDLLDHGARSLDDGDLREHPAAALQLRRTIGAAYLALGQYAAANDQYLAAQRLIRDGADAPADAASSVLIRRAQALLELRKERQAADLLREALDLVQRQEGSDSARAAACKGNLALALFRIGDLVSAEPLFREALADFDRQPDGPDLDRAACENGLGVLLMSREAWSAAEPLIRRARTTRTTLLPADHPERITSESNLAELLIGKGEFVEAEAAARRAVDMARQVWPDAHPNAANAVILLGSALLGQRRPADAEPLLREGYDARRRAYPAGHWRTASAQSLLGDCLMQLSRSAEAERLLLRAAAAMDADASTPAVRLRETCARLRAFYVDSGNATEASRWEKRLNDMK